MGKLSWLAAMLVLLSGASIGVIGIVAMADESKQSAQAEGILYQDWKDTERSRDVPVKIYLPKTGSAPYPVVIFSHGLGGSRDAAVYLGEAWSRHGYLCVFVQHHGSDTSVWQSVAKEGRQAMFQQLEAAANGQNLLLRVGDIKFALNELERLNRTAGALKGKIDLKRIALAGHSFGAGTALAVAGESYPRSRDKFNGKDKRIKSAIYLCPPASKQGTPAEIYGSIDIPGMLLTGTEDDSPIGRTNAGERRTAFDGMKAPHQYLINFIGADHAVFGGRGFRPALKTDAKYQSMVVELSSKFLDASLNEDASAWHWLDSKEVTTYLGDTAQFEKK